MPKPATFKRQLPFIVITLIFLFVAVLDRLIPEGMFFDGVIYAAVSRNTAIGKGSFWLPYYGHSSFFFEHPPLMFSLEAIFFKIFGDHYATEKIYSFFTWLVSLLLIKKLWITSTRSEENYHHSYWLPLLLWGINPTVLWAYPNNLLECTMCVFDLAAVLFIYQAFEKNRNKLLYLAIAGVLILLASLTKGPVGLFPLAIPVIYWFAFRKINFKEAFLWSVFLFIFVAAIFVILWQFPAPHENFSNYLNQQLFKSLEGGREKVDSPLGRFSLIVMLVTELLPTLVISVLILVLYKLLGKRTTVIKANNENKKALFFFLTGLAASLPIMVSIKQRSFYLVPSIPYFAIALAIIVYPYLSLLIKKYTLSPGKTRILNILMVIAAIASVPYLISKIGTVGREQELVHDMEVISTVMQPGDRLYVCFQMHKDYPLLAYLERYRQIEIRHKRRQANFILVDDNTCPDGFTDVIKEDGFSKLDLPSWKYVLYKREKTLPLR